MSTSDLAAKRAALSDTKRALLQARLRGNESAAAPARDSVTRCAGPGPIHPLSYAQERMWFMSQYDPDLPIYNVPVAILVRADLDVDKLEQAYSKVVARHEALRTVYRLIDGEPRQVVLDPYRVRAEIRDVRDRIGSDFKTDVQRLVEEEGARKMDIINGPLIRFTLLRVTEERFALVTTTHHIATDGWAYPLILAEVEHFYEDLMHGRVTELPEPALRYADYAVWEREHLQGETLEKHVRFWREHLAGSIDTEVPGDRPRPAQQSFRGAFHHFRVPLDITDAARALARQERITLNMVLLSAFDLLLARYSDTDDVTVGTLLGNRVRPELEQVVGFFVNTGAVRLKLHGDPTFRELVQRARRVILDATEHQMLPFDKVVEAVGVQRSASRQPLFQIMYFHHVYTAAYQQRSGGVATLMDPLPIYDNAISLIDTGSEPFDVMVATLETAEGMDGILAYARDLYDAPSMATFADRFARLVKVAAANPDLPISRLSLLDDEEERRIQGWSETPAPASVPASVVEVLERRAAETPDAEALVADDHALSYAELMERARALAVRLRGLGVGPEVRVAVCMERGADLPIAMLGVMRAGGVYVPVDPELPADRIRYLLEDSGAAVVLTQMALADRIPSTAARIVPVDADDAMRPDAADAALPHSRTDALPHSQSAAYVIYTSGSTGRPKGVVVPHGALASRTVAVAEAHLRGPGDRVLQFASPSFDVSMEEVFPTWAAGGAVVLRTAATPVGVNELLRWAEARGVTVMNLPTPFWLEMVREMEERGVAPPSTQRLMIVGSDRARPEAFAAWERVGRGIPLLNAYGPTECTVTATVHAHAPGADPLAEVPIGRPLPGARALVLDRQGKPVPHGMPGELYLGGDGVARGYLGKPALTAERFVPDPFSAEPGARMYRTGDRARWRADGELDFMGRLDEQVKVRGFRIEPGEVEAALRTHPAVRRAAVAAREDRPGQRRLVAYVVADGEMPDAGELRRHLRERLPEYMVPAVFVPLDALPMTASGKIDRRALPDPEPAAPVATTVSSEDAPRGPVEETLARLWAQALGREAVGVHDNYFELGGDSILSILIIGRAAEQGIRLTPRQMFLHPTIAELASVAGTSAAVQAEQGPVTGEVPLTPIQHWYLDPDPADAHHWNHAVYLELPEGMGEDAVRGGFRALLEHHDALRLRYERGPDGWRQWSPAPDDALPLDVVDLAEVADGALDAAILPHAERAQAGLRMEEGLARAVLFQLGPQRRSRLLLILHHLVVDVVSWAVVMEDLQNACAAAAAGEAPRLPAKTTSFKAWAERLAEHARAPEVLAQAAFWRGTLAGAAPRLPLDDPSGPNTEAVRREVGLELDEADTESLVRGGTAAYGVRVDELLLAGLVSAVREWSGAEALLVEVEGHGREELFDDVDVSRTVGWFTASYPLRLSAPAAAGPGETLKAVKEQLRAVPERGMSWGLLRWMAPDDVRASMAALPWPEITFNYLGASTSGVGVPAPEGGFRTAGHAPGLARSLDAPIRERISVEAAVQDGRVAVLLRFGGGVFREETVRRLADAYAKALHALAAHCAGEEAGGFTPSDFPEAGLDQGALDALMSQLGGLD
jgi:amino acid adenylation domain-containing protein/non-ribosomal peptide synthase protein (TIGR01720 family)